MSVPEDRLIIGDAPETAPESLCGCGATVAADRLAPPANAPSLSAVVYRVGDYSDFFAAAIAGLSSREHPQLERLATRDPADFTVALLDAWAVASDVLTFYQERIANEQYLRTATERLSVMELARLVGYRPRPGVAAGTHLAFTVEDARTDASTPHRELSIARSTRVQSIPGPGEKAQTFETLAAMTAHPEWNVLKAQQSIRRLPQDRDVELYIRGIDSGLKAGDAILLVGDERLANPRDNHWDFRRLTSVQLDVPGNRTRLTWQRPLGSLVPRMTPALNSRLFALRLRASLFGFNAPSPKLLHPSMRADFKAEYSESGGVPIEWNFEIATEGRDPFTAQALHALLELDGVYAGVAEQGWLVLSRPEYQELYRIDEVTEVSTPRFAISGKRTRAKTDTAVNLFGFEREYRHTAVFAQSEELALASTPVTGPVHGARIALDKRIPSLERGRPIIFRGPRPRLRVLKHGLTFAPSAPGQASRSLAKSTELFVIGAPVQSSVFAPTQWPVRDADGIDGTIVAASVDVQIIPARVANPADPTRIADPIIAELALVQLCTDPPGGTTEIELARPLENAFDRSPLEILANVSAASHGESVSEILGSGMAHLARQTFELKQSPLTYVSSATASGASSTLEVRVDDVAWREVDNLLSAAPADRVYITRQDDDGTTVVEFGDGVLGQRLPSGRDNVRATYRKGIGVGGQVRAGQLTTPLKAPLGVKSVTNPLAATGAAGPEELASARRNAPMRVKTLARTVSLRDYQDFAMTFAGVDKAIASWTWDGSSRRVLLTVAGAAGAAIAPDGELMRNLVDELLSAGQPTVSVEVRPFVQVHFRMHLKVKVHPDHLAEVVLPRIDAVLHDAFGFEHREFSQGVSQSEVIATAQRVDGVVAVDLDALYRTAPPNNSAILYPRLPAQGPRPGAGNQRLGAELLTLQPGPLTVLEVMP